MVKFTGTTTRAIGVALTIAIPNLVSAANICAYTSRNCFGYYGCCYNIPANVCCLYPTNYGWSTYFSAMPTGWFGSTYGDTCSTSTGGGGSSSGQACLSVANGPSYLAAKSSRWIVMGARRAEEITERDASKCVEVDTFGFTGKDGRIHEIKIATGKTLAELQKLAEQGKFDELEKLE